MNGTTMIQWISRPASTPVRPWRRFLSRDRFPMARLLFTLLAVWGGGMMWLCPHLPLIDLPQHAAQASLMRELLNGSSPWESLVQVNLFTPYALEYFLALALAFFPIHVAFTIILEIAYFGFLWALLALRRALKGDPRLDIFFVPGFFGFAWQFGFVPFLVAAPLCVLFLMLARDHARTPTRITGLWLMVCGFLLFFAHGLAFLFALLAGSLLTAEGVLEGRWAPWRLLAPYLPLALLALTYHLLAPQGEPGTIRWGLAPVGRLAMFFFLPLGIGKEDKAFALLTLLILTAPWLLGCRLNKRAFGWWVPFTTVVVTFFLVPSSGMGANYIYPRFALFILPTYALLFHPADARSTGNPWRPIMAITLLAVGGALYLGIKTMRLRAFSRETTQIDALIRSLPRGKRVLSLIVARGSEAARNPGAYEHYLLWYQACRSGFVEVNFASYKAQVVRFRPGHRPAVPAGMESRPLAFHFGPHKAWIYDYIIVKGDSADARTLVERVTGDSGCPFTLLTSVNDWKVFGRQGTARA